MLSSHEVGNRGASTGLDSVLSMERDKNIHSHDFSRVVDQGSITHFNASFALFCYCRHTQCGSCLQVQYLLCPAQTLTFKSLRRAHVLKQLPTS